MKSAFHQKRRILKDLLKAIYYGLKYKDRHAPNYVDLHDELISIKYEKQYQEVPKIIWMYWNDTPLPSLVSATVDRLQALNPDHHLRMLNDETIGNYLDASFMARTDVTLSHKSDILRLELLHKYGGIWIDGTCIFNETLDWVHRANKQYAFDLIAYYRQSSTVDIANPVIESWFLCTHPANEFIGLWKDEFNRILLLGSVDYYNEISSRPDYDVIRQRIDRPEYLVVYLAAQIAMRKSRRISYFLRKAESSAFLYQQSVKWDREWMATILCRLQAPTVPPPVIKLTSSNRYLLATMLKFKLVKHDSIIGKFI